MPKNRDETEAHEARAALRAGLKRAHELVSEAKQKMCPQAEPEPQPPNPAG
jgi:hypothetical protein